MSWILNGKYVSGFSILYNIETSEQCVQCFGTQRVFQKPSRISSFSGVRLQTHCETYVHIVVISRSSLLRLDCVTIHFWSCNTINERTAQVLVQPCCRHCCTSLPPWFFRKNGLFAVFSGTLFCLLKWCTLLYAFFEEVVIEGIWTRCHHVRTP